MSSNSSQNIQVTIEFGHHATFRKKPSSEGYTHDWTVFVRGPEGSKIQHYVEKVVFQLHESFSKPKRVVKDPPYQVSESGYAGFNLPIVIYFRSKEKPKKLSFDYDLFLHADQCTNHVHYEQLTFTNPNEEFRHKLLKACGQPMGTPSSLMDPSSVGSVSKSDSNVKKVKSSSSSSKDISSSKSKHKSSNISGNSSKPLTPQSTPVASKEIRSATSTPSSTSVAPKEPTKSRGKEAQKRPSTSSPPDGETSGKKLKRSSSVSSEHSKDKHTHKSDKHKHSKDSSKKKSKHEHKSNKHGKKEKHSSKSEKKEKSSKHSSSSEHKSKKSSSDSLPILPLDIPTKTALLSPLKVSSDEDDEEEERTMKKDDSDSVSSPCSDLSSSSSDSISLSPLPEAERKKNSSKYDSLMADLGDPDTSDDDFNVPIPIVPLSPLDKTYTETKPSTSSSTKSPKTVSDTKSPKKVKSSSLSSSQSKKSNSKPEKTKLKETKVKKEKESKSSKVSKSNSKERESSIVLTSQNGTKDENKGDTVAMNGETISSLWALHDRIMASRDSEMLDEVVGLIQETGLFKVTDTTFDFDLCVLDKETVQKIFKCVSSVS